MIPNVDDDCLCYSVCAHFNMLSYVWVCDHFTYRAYIRDSYCIYIICMIFLFLQCVSPVIIVYSISL